MLQCLLAISLVEIAPNSALVRDFVDMYVLHSISSATACCKPGRHQKLFSARSKIQIKKGTGGPPRHGRVACIVPRPCRPQPRAHQYARSVPRALPAPAAVRRCRPTLLRHRPVQLMIVTIILYHHITRRWLHVKQIRKVSGNITLL